MPPVEGVSGTEFPQRVTLDAYDGQTHGHTGLNYRAVYIHVLH
jgi:hypothetical protein